MTPISVNPAAIKAITIENPAHQVVQVDSISNDTKSTIPAPTVKDIVSDYFKDTPILIKVAECESQFRQLDSNGNILRGIENHADVGVMQINETYHLARAQSLGLDIYTLQGNMAYAKNLYNELGTSPWLASSPCWSK